MTLNGALDQQEAPRFPLVAKADWATDEPGKISVGSFGSVLMPGETRWYRLDLWERETAWIWGDLWWPPGLEAGGHFETIILDSDGNRVEAPVGHGEYPLRSDLPGVSSPMTGAAIQGPKQGWSSAATYLVGLRWDAPSQVFLGSLNIGVEVLNGDPVRYLARTELQGSLDPGQAPVLPLTGRAENGSGWRGGEFRGRLTSGETRWYRLDLERGEVMNAFALFPGDRFVGEGTEGEFSIVLTDADGRTVGSAFDEWPQMTQSFGAERHQATVSGTTSFDRDPVPETVLVGFSWNAPAGQASEILFEAEAILDPQRKQIADRLAAEATTTTAAVTGSTDEPPPSDTPGDADAVPGGGSFPGPVVILAVGVLAIVVTTVLVRRSRAP